MTPKPPSRRITRRRFLKAAAGIGVGGLAAGALDALAIEPKWIRVSRPEIAVAGLPEAWSGARVAQLTDLHHGRLVSIDLIRKAVGLAMAAEPDLIVLTGDYVSRGSAISTELAAALRPLSAPLGVFAVLGNHDHWTDADGVRRILADAGIPRIDNAHVVLTRGGRAAVLAGVGDLWEGHPNVARALRGAPEGAPRLLLCHNPDYADEMPPQPRVDLMLCGHTHGGQVKIPFGPRPRLPVRNARYGAGLAQGPQCPLYVSRGIGMVGVPVRFNCRPELPIITLRRPKAVDTPAAAAVP